MPIIAQDNGSKFPKLPLPEAGTVQAVCCGVWDLGLQKSVFQGTEKIQHKIVVAWEIDEKIDAPDSEYHGKPYMLSKKYKLSLNEQANLRRDLESWRGKPFTADDVSHGFDVERLYGVNCLIGITHEPSKANPATVYANVTAILPLPKNMEKIQPLRTRDEEPPKWVLEIQAQAIDPYAEGDPFDYPASTDDLVDVQD